MPLHYVVAQRRFKYAGALGAHIINTGDVLQARQLTKLSTLLESGYVKGLDPMAETYDPNELKKLAKDVDANVTEGDPENPTPRNEHGVTGPEGVPNPNETLRTPETPMANQPVRELEGEDVEAAGADAANTNEGQKAVDAHTKPALRAHGANHPVDTEAEAAQQDAADERKAAKAKADAEKAEATRQKRANPEKGS